MPARRPRPDAGGDRGAVDRAALAELDAVQMQIRQIGVKLALDAAVLANHPDVQSLDAAGRRIGRPSTPFAVPEA